MDTEMMTYRELADRLGVKLESARKTVRRKGWRRVDGNDGTIRIAVPVEALPVPADSPTVDAGDSPSDSLPVVDVAILEERIEGLKALADAERRRADAAEADRDAWRAMAERPLWRRVFG
ncbi:hypothetical protein CO653_34150 [Rhizobium anhuiense]|nr:hypothetical protein CO653_34150 [Rhizobium anhuiense]